jgi:hypothetical protein
MMPPIVLAFSLTFCCPLNQFAFPSVSLFWRMYKLTRVNDLRSDSPLNSASVEWPQSGLRRPKLLLLMRCCLEASLVAANERCKVPVWVGCLCDFTAKSETHIKDGVHVFVFGDRQSWTPLSGTEVRVLGPAPPSPIKRSINVQAIGRELSEFSGGTDADCPRTTCRGSAWIGCIKGQSSWFDLTLAVREGSRTCRRAEEQ